MVKNGYLVAERYYHNGAPEQMVSTQSVSTSYTAALVGIVLDHGCLSSLDQKMLDFFPELTDHITDPRKAQITTRDLLQMRAGYPWEEEDPKLWEALWAGHYLPMIVHFPLVSDPGTQFHYSNLTADWLDMIVAPAAVPTSGHLSSSISSLHSEPRWVIGPRTRMATT